MTWILAPLAEMWRWRWRIGLPTLIGLLWGVMQVAVAPHEYEARVLLQLQSEQAREPLLQKITAQGHKEALSAKLKSPDLLTDTGRELGVQIDPEQVSLLIFNDHFLGISYHSNKRKDIEQIVDSLAFNFIQQVLAPERGRVEKLLNDARQALTETLQEIESLKHRLAEAPAGQPAAPGGAEAAMGAVDSFSPATLNGAVGQLELKRQQLEGEILQLQTDLRLVNTAFDRSGSQALLWFAQPATLVPPTPFLARLLMWMLWGGLVGFVAGWAVFKLPEQLQQLVTTARDVHHACGLPLVGTLPWLGSLKINHGGVHISAQGRILRPAGFSEIGRLQATLLRSLRGPLVLTGVAGSEGVSTLALLLAEKSASLGKKVILVDLNLKNHELSRMLGIRGEGWSLPGGGKKRGKDIQPGWDWTALQPLTGLDNLRVLPAPRNPETLKLLGEQGGVAELLDDLSAIADVVIVDASPVAATNRGNIDAVAVAGAGKRAVLMAQAGQTRPGDLRMAADSLLLAGVPLQGVLLNQQFMPSRRQLLGEVADFISKFVPPLGRKLRAAVLKAKVE